MEKSLITPEEGAELERLYKELPAAQADVLAAIRTKPPSYQYDDEGQRKLMAAQERESAIIRRIKEILGVAGKPWQAL